MRAVVDRLRRDPGLALVIAAVLAALVLYAPSFTYGIVNYDDPTLIANNWIVQHASWSSLHVIFFDLDATHRFVLSPEYLPIRDLSIMLDFVVWGHWYQGFHITAVVLYVATIVLWFRAVVELGLDRRVAGLAMLVWAVHPSHAESVAWLAERKGLLAAMFAGACALGYARFRSGGGARWLVLAVVAAVCAVWSKAPGAFAIAALAGLELALPARRRSWRRSLAGLAAIGTVAAAAFVPVLVLAMSSTVVGTDAPIAAGRVATVLGVHGFYLRSFAMTTENAISYPIASAGPTAADLVIGALGLAIAIAVIAIPRRMRWAPPDDVRAGAILWWFGWLPIGHAILPLQMVLVADRYLLLPSIGLALIVAALIVRIPSARGAAMLALAIVAASAIRTLDARSNWRDEVTLWERATTSNPADGHAWTMFADSAMAARDPVRRATAIAEGLKHGTWPSLVLREALLVLEHGSPERGLELLRQSAEGGEVRAMSRLAQLLLQRGDVAGALGWARRAVESSPNYGAGLRVLGTVAAAAGHPDEAVDGFARAYALEPGDLTNRFNLALALIGAGRAAEARPHLEACLAEPAVAERARALLSP